MPQQNEMRNLSIRVVVAAGITSAAFFLGVAPIARTSPAYGALLVMWRVIDAPVSALSALNIPGLWSGFAGQFSSMTYCFPDGPVEEYLRYLRVGTAAYLSLFYVPTLCSRFARELRAGRARGDEWATMVSDIAFALGVGIAAALVRLVSSSSPWLSLADVLVFGVAGYAAGRRGPLRWWMSAGAITVPAIVLIALGLAGPGIDRRYEEQFQSMWVQPSRRAQLAAIVLLPASAGLGTLLGRRHAG